MSKVCMCCKEHKPLSSFSRDRQKADGLSSYCRVCAKAKNQASYVRRTGPLVNQQREGLSVLSPNEYAATWRQDNVDKVRAYNKTYAETHRAKIREKNMRRYADQTNQTPGWLRKVHLVEMEGMYLFCQVFPQFQVDHVVPIKGKQVSGLHVPWNLQVLPRIENVKKSNTFNPSVYHKQSTCAYLES